MKNILSYNFKNNEILISDDNNSFYSFQSYPRSPKIINRKRPRFYEGRNILNKIKKIQKSQNNTNNKLDLIISIIKNKLLGEYDYDITHYDFYYHNSHKKPEFINDNKDENNKEDNDFNIKDDFSLIESIKKEPYSPSCSIYKKKIQKHYENKTSKNSTDKKNENIGNLGIKEQKSNDFVYQNENGKNNNEYKDVNNNENENNQNNNIDKDKENDNFNINDINEERVSINIKKEIKKNNNYLKNNKTFDEIKTIKNNINSILNNLNKSFKNEIDLNKYKIEVNNNNNNNTQLKSNNNNKNNINDISNECNKNEPLANDDKKENSNNIEKSELDNININQEIENKEINENNNNINNEDELGYEKKMDSSQNDTISESSVSKSSGKKSNNSSSRKIRGFNFRNNIKIKKYNSKYDSSALPTNSNSKK